MALIDAYGIFEGERLARCSKMAQLYYDRFLLASNGFGRIQIDYSTMVGLLCRNWKAEDRPSEFELMGYIQEYHQHRLLFLYRTGAQVWGQWDLKKGTFGRYQTKADRRSPEPPADEFKKWMEENRANSQKVSTIAQTPSATADLFPEISENLRKNSANLRQGSEILPHGVGVDVGTRCLVFGVGDGVRAREKEVEQNSNTHTQETPDSIPEDSDITVELIASAHPRYEAPPVTHHEIIEQVERLATTHGSRRNALNYLYSRVLVLRKCVDGWPPGDRQFLKSSARWFREACFDEDETNWERVDARKQPQQNGSNKAGTLAAVTAGVDRFLRSENGVGNGHVSAATSPKFGNTG